MVNKGKIFYVIGPSGSGKDTLLSYCRQRLAGNPGIVFAHRYITRPHDAGGENHIALSEAEFEARLAGGLFAMHWGCHGLRYGIGKEIDLWLAKGIKVVLNGSRECLNTAITIYPELTPVLIEVAPEILRQRLQSRNRETPDELEQRILRGSSFHQKHCSNIISIHNNGDVEQAGNALTEILLSVNSEQFLCA